MILRGLVPQMPTDAAKLHPDLFGTRNAAKMAYHKAGLNVVGGTRLVSNPYREVSIMEGHQPRLVKFQPAGKGQTSRLAIFSPELFKDIRSTLEAALGPLAAFEIIPAPEPGPTGPEPEASPPLAPDPDDPGITVRRYPKLSSELICQQIQWFGRNKVPYLSRAGVQAGAAHA